VKTEKKGGTITFGVGICSLHQQGVVGFCLKLSPLKEVTVSNFEEGGGQGNSLQHQLGPVAKPADTKLKKEK